MADDQTPMDEESLSIREQMRRHVRIGRLADFDQDREDYQYWTSRPTWERLAAIERIRSTHWGPDYDPAQRLPRIH